MDEKVKNYSTMETRRRAVEAVRQRMSRGAVAEAFGVDRATLYRWMKKFEQGGEDGLRRKQGSGRPRALGELSADALEKMVLGSPVETGFETDLWTVARLQAVITEKLDVEVSKQTIWRRLIESGLTCQKPERAFYEADDAVRRKWRRCEIPRIKRCVAENKAILVFHDESNISLSAFLGRTWAPCGQTPAAVVTGNRANVSAMSAISSGGASLVFRLYDKRVASTEVIEFLTQMLRHHPRRHLAVVMDRATPHTSAATRDFIESQKRLHVFYLPPDWNPDEKVWNHLKCHALKSHRAKTKFDLHALAHAKLESMASNPQLLRGIFKRCCIADLLE